MKIVPTRPDTLALDLEGTLISNAMSCFPRPGLASFLDLVTARFERVVLYTAVAEARVRPILQILVDEGSAPSWFAGIENVAWSGEHKDLRLIPGAVVAQTLLVDDLPVYVHPEQRSQWVPINPFAAPYPDDDRELEGVGRELIRRLEGRG